MSTLKITPRLILPAAIALALFILALSLNFLANRQYQTSLEWVSHSHEVIAKMNRIVALVRESEGNARLIPYSTGSNPRANLQSLFTEIQRESGSLLELVRDNPDQATRAEELGDMLNYELSEILRQGSLRPFGQSAPNASGRTDDRWVSFLQRLEVKADQFIGAEEAFLADRRRQFAQTTSLVTFSLGLCLFFATLAIISGALVVRRTLLVLEQTTRLEHEKERAERADQLKTEFLANMSHEIRTPMNSVLGFTDLLRKTKLEPDQQRYLDAIRTGGNALLSIINDILDISKIEAGQFIPQLAPTSIPDTFASIRTIFAEQARREELDLVFEVDPSLPRSLLFDPTRLRQILLNLVGNALKFTDHGQITVTARSTPNRRDGSVHAVTLTIADTGRGISEADLERIFRPFEQVRASGNPQRGTGLGLSITKRLTEYLHGTIEVHSVLGQGTTFTLHFPHIPESSAVPLSTSSPPFPGALSKVAPSRILIADDVPLNRDLLEGIFRDTPHEVILAGDGAEAVEKAQRKSPDVILMDIRMPGMDGRQARQILQENPQTASIPVIAVTASSMLSEENELRNTFQGYLRKPFSVAQLFECLAAVRPVIESEQEVAAAQTNAATASDPDATQLLPAATPSQDPAQDTFWHPLPPTTDRWRELAAELKNLLPEYETTIESHSHQGIANFAQTVKNLGHQFDCEPVARWGTFLETKNTRFQVSATEIQLADFPRLIDHLRRQISPS